MLSLSPAGNDRFRNVELCCQIAEAFALVEAPHNVKLELQGKLARSHHRALSSAVARTRYQDTMSQYMALLRGVVYLFVGRAPRRRFERKGVARSPWPSREPVSVKASAAGLAHLIGNAARN